MNNPPAFPNDVKQITERVGMTLRDYFAAKAMQGILTDPEITMGALQISELSYKYADAMLKARGA